MATDRRHSPAVLRREADAYVSTWIEQATQKERTAQAMAPVGQLERAETEAARAALLRVAAQAVQNFARNGGKS